MDSPYVVTQLPLCAGKRVEEKLLWKFVIEMKNDQMVAVNQLIIHDLIYFVASLKY